MRVRSRTLNIRFVPSINNGTPLRRVGQRALNVVQPLDARAEKYRAIKPVLPLVVIHHLSPGVFKLEGEASDAHVTPIVMLPVSLGSLPFLPDQKMESTQKSISLRATASAIPVFYPQSESAECGLGCKEKEDIYSS
ncbi:hypothetical protein NDU88_003249 [Pleurodeles waltl]|uniref:Uncharacterized protein n=1 Tax=Pleurodeles waltl TaxID=8319 RepID=A0AAV7T5K9_PLEWA|nr:hypothetical protein NDU88_003249 [Pleurodeles waltl]